MSPCALHAPRPPGCGRKSDSPPRLRISASRRTVSSICRFKLQPVRAPGHTAEASVTTPVDPPSASSYAALRASAPRPPLELAARRREHSAPPCTRPLSPFPTRVAGAARGRPGVRGRVSRAPRGAAQCERLSVQRFLAPRHRKPRRHPQLLLTDVFTKLSILKEKKTDISS